MTAGHFIDEIAALGSIPSCSTFVAHVDSKLLCIPPLVVQRLLNTKPTALSKLIQISLDHLSPLVRYLDLTGKLYQSIKSGVTKSIEPVHTDMLALWHFDLTMQSASLISRRAMPSLKKARLLNQPPLF